MLTTRSAFYRSAVLLGRLQSSVSWRYADPEWIGFVAADYAIQDPGTDKDHVQTRAAFALIMCWILAARFRLSSYEETFALPNTF